jgi:serine palmitoyltransferase
MDAAPAEPTAVRAALEPLFAILAFSLSNLEAAFSQIPGSAVVVRYVKSSHQNDPGRTILELLLVAFAVRTLLQSRRRADKAGKHFIQFTDKVRACCYQGFETV